jgi:hypothetical protein
MANLPDAVSLEQRLQRIERRLGLADGETSKERFFPHPAWAFVLGLAASALGYLGVGYPQHYYQILFAGLLTLLLYHRGILRPAHGPWKWPQMVVNLLLLCLLFKLLIGGGMAHPFDWVKLPTVTKAPPTGEQTWYSMPDYSVQWLAVPSLAAWSIDVTRIQTLLFVVIFAGALFRFEPFTSIAALVLLIVSIPSYFHYSWDRVILFLIAGSVSLYLQARAYGRAAVRL